MHRLITIPNISLVNIVANRRIVQEYLQDAATPEKVSAEVFKILDDATYRTQIKTDLNQVKENLGEGNGPKNMATLIQTFI
jgi:lipid-A-disaccharide synthase